MTKKNFINALKIMCVLAPIILPLFVGIISFISSSISISGITTTANSGSDNGALSIAEDYYLQGMPMITAPLVLVFRTIGNSSIGAPIVSMIDWTTTNLYGIPFETLADYAGGVEAIYLFPLCITLVIFWYLIVELVFFIPEVIILFIRWAKNLIYAFTRKGGFDA